MPWWRIVAYVLIFLLPGGSLVLLAMAAAKALQLSKVRLTKEAAASVQSVPVAMEAEA